MAETNPWKTLSSRVAYKNDWICVREDDVIRPDGKTGIYSVVEIPASVGIVALNSRDEIALVGQWRYPLGRYTWEIPRGGSQGHPDILAVAKRELAEEAGVEAAKWQGVGTVDVNNGVTNDTQTLFLATCLRPASAHQDPFEQVTVEWHPFAEAVEMVMNGKITEVCSVSAILKVEKLRKQAT
jgi:8-oxo-dGTP pyrophosphatase MutT (NUDIX family)